MLRQLDHLPPGLLECSADQLESVLGGPTLIHLKGRRASALFVSLLLHGNETTGWDAVTRLLRSYDIGGGVRSLPRSVSLFIGNVAAAAQGVRRLDGQPDYNRVWPGSEEPASTEQMLMQQVFDIMRERGLFASVDLSTLR